MSAIGINSLDIFNLNPLPSWIYEVETSQILEVNKVALEHYGYSKEEFLKLTLFDLRPVEEIPKLIASQKKHVLLLEMFILEFLRIKKDWWINSNGHCWSKS